MLAFYRCKHSALTLTYASKKLPPFINTLIAKRVAIANGASSDENEFIRSKRRYGETSTTELKFLSRSFDFSKIQSARTLYGTRYIYLFRKCSYRVSLRRIYFAQRT